MLRSLAHTVTSRRASAAVNLNCCSAGSSSRARGVNTASHSTASNGFVQCPLFGRREMSLGRGGMRTSTISVTSGSVATGTGGTTSMGTGRNNVAGVAIASDWCGRLWL